MQPLTPDQATFLLHNIYLPGLKNENRITRSVIEAIPLDKGDYKLNDISMSALGMSWHIVMAENRFIDAVLTGAFDLIDPADVALAEIRQTLRITIVADYPALFVIAPLQQALQRTAPGIDIVIQPWHGTPAACAALLDGSSDLAFSDFPQATDELHRQEVLIEHYSIAMRAGHPAAEAFDLKAWLAYPHVIVSGRSDGRTLVDTELVTRGLSRHVGFVVPTFQMVPALLEGSDMMAMLPSRVLRNFGGLVSFPPPIPVSGSPMQLAWHRRRAKDPGLQHVAAILGELLR